MHRYSPNRPKKIESLPAREVMVNVFWGHERGADGGIHETRDHNVTNALRNTKKALKEPPVAPRVQITTGSIVCPCFFPELFSPGVGIGDNECGHLNNKRKNYLQSIGICHFLYVIMPMGQFDCLSHMQRLIQLGMNNMPLEIYQSCRLYELTRWVRIQSHLMYDRL
jgi:hypothetical protein